MQAVVIAQDPDEKDTLVFLLRKAGVAVASSSDLRRVLATWSDHPADLIVVALAADEPAQDAVEAIRAITMAPILMLVEMLTEASLCRLLHSGADTVLIRPISPMVLIAHVHALTRRAGTVPSFVLPTLELNRIVLDPPTRTVTVSGHPPQRLTQLEFSLLFTLMTNRGQVVPVDAIVERVWGYTGEGNRDLVRGLISRLRRKIEPIPEGPRFLENIPGVGYRFMVDEM